MSTPTPPPAAPQPAAPPPAAPPPVAAAPPAAPHNIQLHLEVPASSNVGDKLQITTGFGTFNFVVPQGAAAGKKITVTLPAPPTYVVPATGVPMPPGHDFTSLPKPHEVDPAYFASAFDVGVTGCVRAAKHAIPAMLASGGGSFLVSGATMALRGGAGYACMRRSRRRCARTRSRCTTRTPSTGSTSPTS